MPMPDRSMCDAKEWLNQLVDQESPKINVTKNLQVKSVHFKKPVTRPSFLSKSVVIFNITTTNMTTLFERNEDRVTGFLK